MATNIEINVPNSSGTYSTYHPKTSASNVDGLTALLNDKLDKTAAADSVKLSSIGADDADRYVYFQRNTTTSPVTSGKIDFVYNDNFKYNPVNRKLTCKATSKFYKRLGAEYEMTYTDFANSNTYFHVDTFKSDSTNSPAVATGYTNDVGDWDLTTLYSGNELFQVVIATTPRLSGRLYIGNFWDGTWQGWKNIPSTGSPKVFSSYFTVLNSSYDESVSFFPTDVDKYWGYYFGDKKDTAIAELFFFANTETHGGIRAFHFRVWDSTNTIQVPIALGIKKDDTPFAEACDAPVDSNGYAIANTRWVRSATGNTTLNAASADKINGKTILYVDSFNATTGALALKTLS